MDLRDTITAALDAKPELESRISPPHAGCAPGSPGRVRSTGYNAGAASCLANRVLETITQIEYVEVRVEVGREIAVVLPVGLEEPAALSARIAQILALPQLRRLTHDDSGHCTDSGNFDPSNSGTSKC